MVKFREHSSRTLILAYLTGFSLLNIFVLYISSHIVGVKYTDSLQQAQALTQKQQLFTDLQTAFSFNHYVQDYERWLSAVVSQQPSDDLLNQLQQKSSSLNQTLDRYYALSNLSIAERDSLFQLKQVVKDQLQKKVLVNLWLEQGIPAKKVLELAELNLQLFEPRLKVLESGLQQDFKRLNIDSSEIVSQEIYQVLLIGIALFILVGMLSYFLVGRRMLILPLEAFERYQNVLNETFGVFKVNEQGRFTYVNAQYCRYRDIQPQALIGEKHPVLSSASHSEIWQSLAHNQSWMGLLSEEIERGGIATSLTMQTLLFTVPFGREQKEFVALQFDITELEKARQLAQEISQAQNYFLTNVGHQLRTPLGAVIGGLKMLSPSELDGRDQRVVELVIKNANDLLHNVNELISYADIERGRIRVETRPHRIERLFADFFNLYRPLAEQKEIQFFYDIDYKLPNCLEFDYQHIALVLENLLHNAFKFTPKGGEVRANIRLVSQIAEDYVVEFEISDTGIGIESTQMKHIFKGFQQLESIETRQFGGTGIGLTIAQKLVKLMGAQDILVESHPKHGSSFRFQLHLKRCEL